MNNETLILATLVSLCITGIVLVVMGELNHRKNRSLRAALSKEDYDIVKASQQMKTGLKECADCKEDFHPGVQEELSFCKTCAPAWDAETPRDQMTYGKEAGFYGTGKAFRPVSMMWPDLFKGEKK